MFKTMILVLLFSSLVGVSGCSNKQCNEARAEESRLTKTMESLAGRITKGEKELNAFFDDYCANLGVVDKSLLDASNEDIWCDDWKRTGSIPPIGGSDRQEITRNIETMRYDYEKSQVRWALTVTTYKNCFGASTVIDATEVLSK